MQQFYSVMTYISTEAESKESGQAREINEPGSLLMFGCHIILHRNIQFKKIISLFHYVEHLISCR